jgi:hypothetical protein
MVSISKSRLTWLYEKESTLDFVFPFRKVSLVNTLTIRSGELAVVNDKMVFTANYLN